MALPRQKKKNMFGGPTPVFLDQNKQTLLFEPASLLDEAHKWCNSSPRANHDDWVCGFKWEAELRLADVHGNAALVTIVSDKLVLQPVGGHSLVHATSLSFILHHHCADMDAVGVNLKSRVKKKNDLHQHITKLQSDTKHLSSSSRYLQYIYYQFNLGTPKEQPFWIFLIKTQVPSRRNLIEGCFQTFFGFSGRRQKYKRQDLQYVSEVFCF